MCWVWPLSPRSGGWWSAERFAQPDEIGEWPSYVRVQQGGSAVFAWYIRCACHLTSSSLPVAFRTIALAPNRAVQHWTILHVAFSYPKFLQFSSACWICLMQHVSFSLKTLLSLQKDPWTNRSQLQLAIYDCVPIQLCGVFLYWE